MKKNNKKGFTLVELVIVIAVIAILAAVLIPTFAGIIDRARENTKLQKATAARDELMQLENVASVDDLKNILIKVDGTYYIIGDNGSITRLGDDLDEISETLGIEFSENEQELSGNTTIITPVLADDSISVPSTLELTWNDLVNNDYVTVETVNNTKVLTSVDNSLMLNNLPIGTEVDTLSFTALVNSQIKKLTIPKSLKNFESYNYIDDTKNMGTPFFGYSLVLTEIVVEDGNPYFYTDGLGLYYNGALVLYALGASNTTYTIKSSYQINGTTHTVDTIGPNVFNTMDLISPVSLNIPDSITNVYFNSFDYKSQYYDEQTNIAYMPKGDNKYYFAVDYCNSSNELYFNDKTEVIASYIVYERDCTLNISNNTFTYSGSNRSNPFEEVLKEINVVGIGKNVKHIASNAFALAKISNFAINSENTYCHVSDDGRCLINGTTLVAYTNNDDTNYYYNSISYSYCQTNPSKILDLSQSEITEIGEMVFYGNILLEQIILPETLELIDTGAFSFVAVNKQDSNHLQIVIPTTTGVKIKLENSAFAYADRIEINTYSKFTKIGNNAFVGCTVMTNDNESDSIDYTIDLDSATSLGMAAFADFNVNCDAEQMPEINIVVSFNNNNTLTKIDDFALQIQGYVSTLTVPSTVTFIGQNTFPASLENLTFEEGNLGYSTFEGGLYKGTTLIAVVDKTTSYETFNIKPGTTEIACYPNAENIENSPFFDVEVENIVLPSSMKILRENAITGTLGLKTIVLNEGLEVIEPYAIYIENTYFDNNSGNNVEQNFVKEIIIPDSIVSIGSNGICIVDGDFYSYAKVAPKENSAVFATDADKFYDEENPDEYYYNSIYNKLTNTLLYVNPFANEFSTEETPITIIPDYAFANNRTVCSIVLPGVTQIGAYAFSYCNAYEIYLSQVLDKVDPEAFKNSCFDTIINYEKYMEIDELTMNMDDNSEIDALWDSFWDSHVTELNNKFEIVDTSCLVNKKTGELLYAFVLNDTFTTEGTSIKLIPNFAFVNHNDNFNMVVLKDVKGIGAYAFAHSNISTIVLSDKLNYVSPYAFKEINNSNIQFVDYNFYNKVNSMSEEEQNSFNDEFDEYMNLRVKHLNNKFNIVDNGTLVNVQNGTILFINPGITEFSTYETGITVIQANDFADCQDLAYVELDGVVSVEAFAFKNLVIDHIEFDSTITQINSSAFTDAIINEIVIPQNSYYGTNADNNFIFSKSANKILYLNPNIALFNTASSYDENNMPVGSTITEITDNYFYFLNARNIQNVNLTGIETIGNNAFTNCPDIDNVYIYATTSQISDTAFINSNVDHINVEPTSTYYATNVDGTMLLSKSSNSIVYICYTENLTFEGMNSTTTITTLTTNFFAGLEHSGFNTVDLYGIETIEDYAFKYAGITTIVIHDCTTSISTHAFDNSNITNFEIDNDKYFVGQISIKNNNNEPIENSDTIIYEVGGEILFFKHYNTTFKRDFSSAEIGVTKIAGYSFWRKNINSSYVNYDVMDLSTVTQIADYGLWGTKINTLVLLDSVSLSDLAFYNTEIRYIQLVHDNSRPQTITVGEYTNHVELSSNTLTSNYIYSYNGTKLIYCSSSINEFDATTFGSNGITEIGSCAFSFGGFSNGNFNINGVTKIGKYAFYLCYIDELYIPETVTYIDPLAFVMIRSRDSSLTKVYVDENNPNYATEIINAPDYWDDSTQSVGYNDVPSGFIYSKDMSVLKIAISYAYTEKGIIELNENVRTIGQYAFTGFNTYNYWGDCYEHRYNNKIILNEGLTTIEDFAFFGSDIDVIVVSSTVTHIGSSAFAECYGLYEIVFEHTTTPTELFLGTQNILDLYDEERISRDYGNNFETYIICKYVNGKKVITLPELPPYRVLSYMEYTQDLEIFDGFNNDSYLER